VSLRLLEFVVRDDESDGISSLLADQEVHQVWITSTDDSTRGFRVLLEAESVEPVTDALTERLGSREECRMVLLPVEATVPRIEETKPPENESADAGSGNGSASPALRISREELYEDLASSTQLTPSYAVMVTLSTVVAAVGLVRDDVAIFIGAMVIAPLLGPNITLSFASTLGDTKLARSALKTLAAGFGVAAAVSFLLGVVLEVDPSATEIASRTGAGIGNIALALAAGAAGSLAFTTGVPAVLVGVMVAVALLPPLATAGLLAGSGEWRLALGALLLLVTNIAAVNLAAMATFLAQQIRPRTWWEADRAKKAVRFTVLAWAIVLVVLVIVIATGQVGPV
jgi:uncharacterized hydrophobic protein (TIGR00341 family)